MEIPLKRPCLCDEVRLLICVPSASEDSGSIPSLELQSPRQGFRGQHGGTQTDLRRRSCHLAFLKPGFFQVAQLLLARFAATIAHRHSFRCEV